MLTYVSIPLNFEPGHSGFETFADDGQPLSKGISKCRIDNELGNRLINRLEKKLSHITFINV